MDVADSLQEHVNKSNSRSVLHISNCQWQLNVVNRKCIQQDEEISEGLILRQDHYALVHVHEFLDDLNPRLFHEKP